MSVVHEKKKALLEDLNKHIACYFEEKAREQWLKEVLRSRLKGAQNTSSVFVCTNPKDQLMEAHDHLMRLLLIIRDNTTIFRCLIHLLDKKLKFDQKESNALAKDIVHFLLADFSFPDSCVVSGLYQLEAMLPVSCGPA